MERGVLTRAAGWTAGLSVALAVVIVASAGIGPVAVPPRAVVATVLDGLVVPVGVDVVVRSIGPDALAVPVLLPDVRFASPVSLPVDRAHRVIVMQLRLPRVILAALVGVALAAAGTVMQGFFRNPMADPSIIGVASGAAVGAVAAIAVPTIVPVGLQPAAAVGGLLAAGGVYAIATQGGRTPVATLLLAGVAVQTFLGAVISFLLLYSGESLERALYWLMGRLAGASWGDLGPLVAVIPLGLAVVFGYARELNVLLMGEAEAHTLGVPVERTKRILLLAATLLTAVAVAAVGVIGFVGLIVPHVMRLLVGPDHRILLPTSAVTGGIFLVAADTVARTATGGAELPVGIVTAAVGAPFFLYLLRDREVYDL